MSNTPPSTGPWVSGALHTAELQLTITAVVHGAGIGISVASSIYTLHFLLEALSSLLSKSSNYSDRLQIGTAQRGKKLLLLVLYFFVVLGLSLGYFVPLLDQIIHNDTSRDVVHFIAKYPDQPPDGWTVDRLWNLPHWWRPAASARIVWTVIIALMDTMLFFQVRRVYKHSKLVMIAIHLVYLAAILAILPLPFKTSHFPAVNAFVFEILAFVLLIAPFLKSLLSRFRGVPSTATDNSPPATTGFFLAMFTNFMIFRTIWFVSFAGLGGRHVWSDAMLAMASIKFQNDFIFDETMKNNVNVELPLTDEQ